MRSLYAHLGATSAGSLLSSPKLKSYSTAILPPVIQAVPCSIATPNWSLSAPSTSNEPYKTRGQLETTVTDLQKQLTLVCQHVVVRDQIIEQANATMVFQNMGLKRMNEALYQKEEKGTADRAKLFKGKAQCLSSDEFYDAVRELEEGRKSKAADKEAKKIERARKKVLQAELDTEWAEMKERHVKAVETWSVECSKLVGEGARKKDLPAKPKLGKKPKLPVVEEEDTDEEEEEGDA
ncbi:hypothetical protein DFH08DRAFT_1036288 [Mycena albidolilacea]|uniref:Uncharacterized protein n=1 Tax=Mycena albidolilacea TaxID=1033008 RepID=A0AAD6ZDE1_9AGAR|nr:hypothetical protein DFH08DRAFT_1036288 [Mycena albidolilacea]